MPLCISQLVSVVASHEGGGLIVVVASHRGTHSDFSSFGHLGCGEGNIERKKLKKWRRTNCTRESKKVNDVLQSFVSLVLHLEHF